MVKIIIKDNVAEAKKKSSKRRREEYARRVAYFQTAEDRGFKRSYFSSVGSFNQFLHELEFGYSQGIEPSFGKNFQVIDPDFRAIVYFILKGFDGSYWTGARNPNDSGAFCYKKDFDTDIGGAFNEMKSLGAWDHILYLYISLPVYFEEGENVDIFRISFISIDGLDIKMYLDQSQRTFNTKTNRLNDWDF